MTKIEKKDRFDVKSSKGVQILYRGNVLNIKCLALFCYCLLRPVLVLALIKVKPNSIRVSMGTRIKLFIVAVVTKQKALI